jgi:hypothetical protein
MTVNLPMISSGPDLLASLERIDISVPRRSAGRKTHHTESWTICRLLSTLAGARLLAYPMSLKHRDRPDFLLQSGAREIGIEVTEAVSEQYAAYAALAEREFPDVWLEPGHFRWGSPKLTIEEMRAILRHGKLTAEPWAGNFAEREWASYMASIVETKAQKLAKSEFEKFSKNWLAIYDNLPMPHIHLGEAVGFLVPLLRNHWARAPSFDTIFIEHGPVIAKISAKSKRHLRLKDLW